MNTNLFKYFLIFGFAAIGTTLPACSQSVVMPSENTIKKEKLPADVLNLTNWKLTLPVDTREPGKADEYKQPVLSAYQDKEWFHVNPAGDAVVFKANAGGVTTSGSGYPRSELREMTDHGTVNASWSSSVGTHTLFIDQKVTHLPDVKPEIVIGQIHDASRYIIFFRLEKTKLLVSVNGEGTHILDDHYVLGSRFNVKFTVSDNETKCYYNGDLKYIYKGSFSGAYFKAGAYVQSSCKGRKKVAGESCNAYGEVEIYNVWVKHE